jgi:hypothetical protein
VTIERVQYYDELEVTTRFVHKLFVAVSERSVLELIDHIYAIPLPNAADVHA